MAILKAQVQFETSALNDLAKQIPDFNGRFLALVGKRSRSLLKKQFLSGQEINLTKYPVDSKGRYTVSSDVNRRQTQTKIYSYPVNLFERGRRLRDGSKEAGKYIITKKLKQAVMMNMGGYINEFENRILQGELDKV